MTRVAYTRLARTNSNKYRWTPIGIGSRTIVDFELAAHHAPNPYIIDVSDKSLLADKSTTNTVLFLTDGEITVGKEGDDFLNYVRSLNHADVDTRVFSYAFGDDVTNNQEASRVLQAVADQNKGVAFRIGDSGDGSTLKTIMAQYYVYWASGIASTQPRWSEIYTDFGTGLDCLTGALPV